MTTITAPVNIEELVKSYLDSNLGFGYAGTPVSFDVPKGKQPRAFIRIVSLQGTKLSPAHFVQPIIIESWASERRVAQELGTITAGVLEQMEGLPRVWGVQTRTGYHFPDPITGTQRYLQTVDFTTTATLMKEN